MKDLFTPYRALMDQRKNFVWTQPGEPVRLLELFTEHGWLKGSHLTRTPHHQLVWVTAATLLKNLIPSSLLHTCMSWGREELHETLWRPHESCEPHDFLSSLQAAMLLDPRFTGGLQRVDMVTLLQDTDGHTGHGGNSYIPVISQWQWLYLLQEPSWATITKPAEPPRLFLLSQIKSLPLLNAESSGQNPVSPHCCEWSSKWGPASFLLTLPHCSATLCPWQTKSTKGIMKG